MKKVTIITGLSALFTVILVYACQSPSASNGTTEISADSLVKRGSYLVNAMGCDDCHTQMIMGPKGPELDMANRFAGHLASSKLGPIDTSILSKGWMLFSLNMTASYGPWGISYSANLTPSETGIGNWTEDQFIYAIRNGKYKGMKEGRPLMPPMPWFMYKNLSDTDLKAIFAYLKTMKPVDNVVPAWVPISEVK